MRYLFQVDCDARLRETWAVDLPLSAFDAEGNASEDALMELLDDGVAEFVDQASDYERNREYVPGSAERIDG